MVHPFRPRVLTRDELREDEDLLHIAHRHIIVLLMRLIAPVVVFLICIGLLWYISVSTQQVYTTRTTELVTTVLGIIALLALVSILYQYADWNKDQIVVTSQRVIYNLDKPLIRRIQEQLPIDDIHQVEAITSSYPEHWLKYGTIKIQSASFGRPMQFHAASHPQAIQARIMEQITRSRKEREDEYNYHDLVNRRVYQDRRPDLQQKTWITRSYTPGMLDWLFTENPEYDSEEQSYSWHPHWFFLIKALVKPVGFLLLALAVIAGGATMNVLTDLLLAGLLLLTALIFIGWAAWQIEDYRNDRYILTPSQVIDIEKKPLGPENQSSAGLDSIQNVTFRTTFFSRLVGYGDVLLELTGSGDKLTFYDIPHPREVVNAISSYQAEFDKNQKERTMDDTLSLLKAYHEMQQSRENGHEPPERSNGHRAPQDDHSQHMPSPDEGDDALLHRLLLEES